MEQTLSDLLTQSLEYIHQTYPQLRIRNVLLQNNVQTLLSHQYEQEQSNRAIIKMFNLSYLYGGNSHTYRQYVSNTNGIVTTVCPSYFDIDQKGNLVITPSFDPSFVREMKQKRIRVIPFLSNHWDRALWDKKPLKIGKNYHRK